MPDSYLNLSVSITNGRKTKWKCQGLISCKGEKLNMVFRFGVDVGATEWSDMLNLKC